MDLGKMTLTEALVYMEPIAKVYGLRLNRLSDFKICRLITSQLYNSMIWVKMKKYGLKKNNY